jgi:type IV secretory pathway VirB2 component (pilin)
MEIYTLNISTAWQICFILMLTTIIIVIPQIAYASSVTNESPMSNALCIAATWITGTTGRARATIAVAILGIGALLGKISWGVAMTVGVAIAVVFGASGIVHVLGGTSTASGAMGNTNCT